MSEENNHFGADVASLYDAEHGNDPDCVARAVEALAVLAGDGPVLEFAIGTGRIALPLAAKGIEVAGIELSQAMVDELRRKELGPPLNVVVGDMTGTRIDAQYAMVILVFNTIDNLTTQEAQVACFANAARHLLPGGRFVVETLIPPLQKIPFGERRYAFANSEDYMGVDEFDIATQTYTSTHLRVEGSTTRRLSIPFRYAWPSEMDLMAKLAGLELEHRWGDWDQSEFTALSAKHVSVWRKPV